MTTQFLSSSKRIHGDETTSPTNLGPGSYSIPTSIQIGSPNFTGFLSSGKRNPFGNTMKGADKDVPSPMTYIVRENLVKKQPVCSSDFNSTSKRFSVDKPWGPLKENWTDEKSMGKEYKRYPSPVASKVPLEKPSTVPSIPMRHQSYGFEPDPASGKLVLQKPSIPGYTGLKQDTVGPMDYMPKPIDKPKATNFGRAATREAYERRKVDGPGPGYYNTAVSSFDDPAMTSVYNDGSFVMRLNSVKRRQTSSFASNSKRESDLPNPREKRPEPGSYTLPSAIQVKTKPPELQNFGSSDSRLKDPIARSLRLAVAPGSYDPLTSDFDNLYAKILKQKRMISKSPWASSIAFNGTDSRLKVFEPGSLPEVNDGMYYPKTNIADRLPKENPNGPFGSGTKRFDFPEHAYKNGGENGGKLGDPFMNVSEGPVKFGGNIGRQVNEVRTKVRMVNNSLIGARKPTSSFSKSKERFLQEKIADSGPPPGTYNVAPSWKANGPLPMKETEVEIRRKSNNIAPGPGDYILPSTIQVARPHRKNVMISTGKRFEPEFKVPEGPGPMDYDPIPLYGNMIRPTHNIMLASEYK